MATISKFTRTTHIIMVDLAEAMDGIEAGEEVEVQFYAGNGRPTASKKLNWRDLDRLLGLDEELRKPDVAEALR